MEMGGWMDGWGGWLSMTPLHYLTKLNRQPQPQQVEAALLPSASASDDRSALLGTLADKALDFLLTYLPSLPLPPFEGATEDNAVAYRIAGLDLGGVRLRKVRQQRKQPAADDEVGSRRWGFGSVVV